MEKLNGRIRRRRREGEGGFTLIELLVVIAILSVLAAIVVFNVSGVKNRGNAAACATDVESVQTAIDTYVNDTGTTGTTYLDKQIAKGTTLPGPADGFWDGTVIVGGTTYALQGATTANSISYLQTAPLLSTECTATAATLKWTDGSDSTDGYTVSGK
jgi:prepilin-type N-terminal cleavage/methylation domain-containing protein